MFNLLFFTTRVGGKLHQHTQVVQLRALDQARAQARDKKPRKLFGELTNNVSGQHGEVVTVTQKTFGRKMRRERRVSSCLPGQDPVSWTQFKALLPEELKKTIDGQDFARLLFVFLCAAKT